MCFLSSLVAVVAFVAAVAGTALPGRLWEAAHYSYLAPPAAVDGLRSPPARCAEPPLCHSPRLTLAGSIACLIHGAPLTPGTRPYQEYARARLRDLLPRMVKGQFALDGVVKAVERKLLHPSELLVMHFAGDNGVGKTRTAEAVSLALGQRCGDSRCSFGDSTLVISGTAYDGMSLAEFRRAVVPFIADHARRFPGNGVLVINELSSLHPDQVRLLLPVLGRGGAFPEYPSADLSALVVILTTDFGREGRTQGLGIMKIQALINADFRELYSHLSTANMRTFPFLPISLQAAREIAVASILEMGCDACRAPVTASADAVSLVVERVKPMLAAENGRAVMQQVVDDVGALVDSFCAGDVTSTGDGSDGALVDLDDEGTYVVTAGGSVVNR